MHLYLLVIFVNAMLCVNCDQSTGASGNSDYGYGFMGTAELVPNNVRKSRLSRDFSHEKSSESISSSSSSSDKLSDDTLHEYGQLLKMDTKNFSQQQKALLERIVERVARLSDSTGESNTTANIEDYMDSTDDAEDNNENEGRGTKNRKKKNKISVVATTTSEQPPQTKSFNHESIGNSKQQVVKIVQNNNKHTGNRTKAEQPHSTVNNVNKKGHQNSLNSAVKPTNVTEVFFGNITTTSIVDSLSDDNTEREDIFGNKRPASTAAAIAAIAAAAASAATDKNKVKVS